MTLFIVERNVRGTAPQAMAAANTALAARASELSANGCVIHLVRTVFVPGDGRCISVFDCGDPVTLWRLLEDVGVPADGAMEVYDPKPPTVADSEPKSCMH